MCEFCVRHGEGKKWYLNAKNYSNDLLSDIKRRKFIEESGYWVDNLYKTKLGLVKLLPFKIPILGSIFRSILKKWMLSKHWGQVIPIEDVEKILSFTNSITRIPCVCRKVTTGKEARLCFLISINPNEIGVADIVDQSFLGGPDVAKFEKVDKKWAMNFIRENEKSGRIHTIWTFNAPFTGALCNCDFATGCIPMKMYREATPPIFCSEYVAKAVEDICIGCRECIKICPFNSIEFDLKNKKAKIDATRCYGCGICRTVCKNNAILLEDRQLIPEAANLW